MLSLTSPLLPYAAQTVIVGVSGGADSVALLLALRLVGARVVAAHLDHALRPESAEDARWVQELCTELGVPCEVARVDVGAVAARRGWNLEDAARRVRYDFLSRVAKKAGASAILTAHTRRDQAETVLMALLRGEAVLHGIPAVRGRVRRPWLAVARADIEAFLVAQNQSWREDPSNANTAFTRAWLRLEVLPVLTARFPGIELALARIARLSAEDDMALSELAARLTLHASLPSQTPAVLRRWVRQELVGAGFSFHADQLEALAAALRQSVTLHLTLPGARQITTTGGKLYTVPQTWPPPDFVIPDGWILRTRRPADRIRLSAGTRKLSDLLTDAKVPRESRDAVPVLVSVAGVQWVGLRPPVWAEGARAAAGAPEDVHHAAMGEALALAHAAAEAGEVPVGAVVLHGGEVVGRGRNTSRQAGDMTRHAELAALREAAATLGTPYLTECTLVVTLEPCPMCLGAALEARIGGIVYGAANPKAGALGGVMDVLAAHWGHSPTVRGGVRAAEAARLLKDAFRQVRQAKLPTQTHERDPV
ncbi:tRNA lysidine(34) synthetase TilS [Deinococcus sp. Arct2-2]|uniref:tRNA lysidine(34) synthetase TilS n=1 Tax=Deinococcus sp. Arct2-2 TaxID=2568653 RepID=UPI0010A4F48D|nr:tRNA lysidine(34) synthetase TilS [Deinococcus sp. Arct2-2]THF70585.1 tRNA lysidine(34) synthetase TilS [Deinococcus sp. Arct2-2]